jgi:hypothetical protein
MLHLDSHRNTTDDCDVNSIKDNTTPDLFYTRRHWLLTPVEVSRCSKRSGDTNHLIRPNLPAGIDELRYGAPNRGSRAVVVRVPISVVGPSRSSATFRSLTVLIKFELFLREFLGLVKCVHAADKHERPAKVRVLCYDAGYCGDKATAKRLVSEPRPFILYLSLSARIAILIAGRVKVRR